MTLDYFTIEEFRDLPDMRDASAYTDAAVERAAGYIVGIIEREVGTSFVARTVTDETHDGDGGTRIVLRKGFVRAVTSASVDGVPVTDTLYATEGGVLLRLSGITPQTWPVGWGNVTVTYTTGYSATPPGDVKEAAMRGTRAHLLANADGVGFNDRRTSLSTDMGVLNFVVAGEDRPTGYPEVDAMILGWKARLDVLGFA